jgi:acyl-CoA thioester hydrolase
MAHTIRVKIYYEDTDAGGVVYYANYLGYLERARTEFLSGAGVDIYEHHREGRNFVVVRVEISYMRPARLGDVIDVTTEMEEMKNASITFRHGVYRDGEVLASALVTLAYTDEGGRPKRLPGFLRKLLLGGYDS